MGAWLARRATDPVDEPDRLTGLAVDGKTVRGSRTDGHAVHLTDDRVGITMVTELLARAALTDGGRRISVHLDAARHDSSARPSSEL